MTTTIQVHMDSLLKKETKAAPNLPNAETRKVLDDALAGQNLSPPFSTVDEMWADLNA